MKYKSVLILSGAGLSAESGVSTFRDAGGVWAQYDYREVATPEGFAQNPALVHEFYNMRRRGLQTVSPNAAHRALARLQEALGAAGGAATLVTQNVDDLLERAGATDVIHMHGELTKARCAHCGAVTHQAEDLSEDAACAACGATGSLRPHIVWFGEMPMEMERIYGALYAADLFVSVGTSGAVYPAAGFVVEARQMGKPCIELNLEPSDNHHLFTDARYGPASEILPAFVEEITAPAS